MPEETKKSAKSAPAKESKGYVMQVRDASEDPCPACQGDDHRLYRCSTFRSWDQPRRYRFVKTNRLCFNCFFRSHGSNDCPSRKSCRECGARHHTLLHRNSNSHTTTTAPPATESQQVLRAQASGPSAVLCTALADVTAGGSPRQLVSCLTLEPPSP